MGFDDAFMEAIQPHPTIVPRIWTEDGLAADWEFVFATHICLILSNSHKIFNIPHVTESFLFLFTAALFGRTI